MSYYDSYEDSRYYHRRNPFIDILVGIVLIIGAIYFLWTNEANSARLIANQSFIRNNVIAVNSSDVNRANDGKLITVNGSLTTDETLSDSNISLDNALVLERKVEVYQAFERYSRHRRHTISYRWSDDTGRSPRYFKEMPKKFTASSGYLGSFAVTPLQTSNIKELKRLTNLPYSMKYKIVNGYYYNGDSFSSPRVGDMRISYYYVPSGKFVSIIGKQNSDNTISGYDYKKTPIYVQYDGNLDSYEIQNKYREDNERRTMYIRIGGFVALFIGFGLLSAPISAIAAFVPFLSALVDGVSTVAALVLAACTSLTTIILAWLYYRPILAVCLIGIIGYLIYYFRNQKPKRPGQNRQRQIRPRRMGGTSL